MASSSSPAELIRGALSTAGETRRLIVGPGATAHVPAAFRAEFGDRPAIVVGDTNTWAAAGEAVSQALEGAGVPCRSPFFFTESALFAEYRHLEALEAALAGVDAVPIAVGAGTINDLVKLAAHRTGRRYLCVPTAASVDGYTAFGASITYRGSKQTFACPAPPAVVADLDILCAVPPWLNASGYADLLAKIMAGADWILADALSEEPIHPEAWELAQSPLAEALHDPAGVRRGEAGAVRRLAEALMLTGFAIQVSRNSRAASGAEHLFSHLWDMQDLEHRRITPLHGAKVGIGTLAVARLYEALLPLPLEELDVDACCARWPEWPEMEARIEALFEPGPLREKAREETAAKHPHRGALGEHLQRLREAWPSLRPRLEAQLLPAAEIRHRLVEAGAPVEPEEIGVTRTELGESYARAFHLRRRYTVLDLAVRTGTLAPALERIFGGVGSPEETLTAAPPTVASDRGDIE